MTELSPKEQLASYMSDLSERSYCAGWMDGLESVLWIAVVAGPRKYGLMEITDEHIAELKRLSDSCGGWIMFDDEQGETFVPLDEWLRIYESNRHRLPDWLKVDDAAPNNNAAWPPCQNPERKRRDQDERSSPSGLGYLVHGPFAGDPRVELKKLAAAR